jgi:hypothetical protein
MTRILTLLTLTLSFAAGCMPPAHVPTPTTTAAPAGMQFFMPSSSCAPGDATCLRVAYGIGDITAATPGAFLAFVAAFPDALSTTAGIVLDSPGGSLLAGLQLGDALRRSGWNTVTGITYPWPDGSRHVATCYSACVWAFAGGVNRYMLTDGALGVHRFYSAGAGDAASAQEVTAYINLYLDRMGVSRVVQDVASLTRSDQMTYLTMDEATRLQLIHFTPATTPSGPAARRRKGA